MPPDATCSSLEKLHGFDHWTNPILEAVGTVALGAAGARSLDVTLEIGNVKWPPASQLPTYWNDNLESMLSYLEPQYDPSVAAAQPGG